MRIISGKMKGTKLYIPTDKKIRPLKDLARESIFNLLTHSGKILFKLEHSNILDLYAGTGSFGLECLSRQAKNVFFVESEKDAVKILKKNIEKLKIKNKSKIFVSDVFQIIKTQVLNDEKFDIIFCDPPFRESKMDKLIETIIYKKILKQNGIIILHRGKSTKENFPSNFKIIEERFYGISKIIFGKIL
ncbi:16S rRNA (guanine(966)-N(2))-methyltransferase RsmD, partial [Pelagibacteraceae bacterium]|nr:16S rRNA (guanine(966)-N(2))-methyltransferase RsmD [Pelagibacteraceae bacterium]